MKFDINNYKGKYVMHCKTKEEAESFCSYLYSVGRKWGAGNSYLDKNYWDRYKSNTVYYFNEGSFGDIFLANEDKHTILEWTDFMNGTFTKSDLKTGDIVKLRCGYVGVVGSDTIMILNDGYQPLYYYNEDLTYVSYKPNDIVAVKRPTKSIVEFDALDECLCPLVYDRERDEPVEMTLAEVCKLLGKNIKIIP